MGMRMPLFMDTHQGTELPDEVNRKVKARVKSGEKDDYGVIDHGVIIDRDAGEMHCVLEAPDAEAVRKHHEWLNVPLEEHTVHRADAILK